MASDETDLAIRAAWLSYVGELTQEDIARRLRVSRVKVARLIALAQRAGLVRVFVEGRIAGCVALEEGLKSRYGLAACEVAPDLGEEGLPLQALASAGARYLLGAIEAEPTGVIGIGHGRTLAATVARLPVVQRPGLRVVSLLGSLTRKASANPYDVIFRLAEVTGGEGYFVPAPFFADTDEDRRVLMAQRSVAQVLDLARQAPLCLVGIGEVGPDAQLVHTGMVTPEESRGLVAAGAVGEVLGLFLDAQGRPVDADINRRAVALSLDELRGREVVAVAGGPAKVAALSAVLRTGAITSLITDETTARRLVAETGPERVVPPAAAGRRRPGPARATAA